jgi:hypothetical protein
MVTPGMSALVPSETVPVTVAKSPWLKAGLLIERISSRVAANANDLLRLVFTWTSPEQISVMATALEFALEKRNSRIPIRFNKIWYYRQDASKITFR